MSSAAAALRSRASGWLPALFLALMTFAVYFPAVHGEFIWDDDLYAANPLLAQPDGLRRIVTLRPTREQYYREFPVVYATFSLERRFWGPGPTGYHLDNIVLHALNAILAWIILRRLGLGGAWVAAAIFALHPVQVESVAWITERKNVLSAFFYLLALLGFLRYEDGEGRGWYAGSLAAFPLALLSKPVTCTLPVVLLLLRWARGRAIERRNLLDLAPYFLTAFVSGLFTLIVEKQVLGGGFDVPWTRRILIAARALWFYPMKLAWPVNLTFSYERWSANPRALVPWLWLAGTAAAGAWIWRRRERLGRGFLAGTAFYVLTILPLLGFVTIYTFRYTYVADHYQYLACLGPIAIGVGLAGRFLRDRRAAGAALTAVVLCALGCAAWRQARIYRSLESLWGDVVLKNPGSWLAQNNLGFALAGRGRVDEAIAHYDESLRLKSDYAQAHLNLGVALAGKGRAAEAEAHYRAAMSGDPEWPVSYLAPYDLALSLQERGEIDQAIAFYQEALRRDPGYVEAREGLGRALLSGGRAAAARAQNGLGEFLWARGARSEALSHFEEAARLDPTLGEAYNNLGVVLLFQKRNADAAAYFREALRWTPGLTAARSNLESALARVPAR